jgi:crotonobetainyl-CoA:carnitine CoA-transferase CaiB-like acyl-CoA transferase
VLDRPDLVDDPRFATPGKRLENRPELFAILGELFGKAPRAHWLSRMRHLPSGPVRELEEALESEEVAHRNMVMDVPHPSGERLRLLGSPLKFSDTPIRPPAAPPKLGEHTDEVLEALAGLNTTKIAKLRAEGIIA